MNYVYSNFINFCFCWFKKCKMCIHTLWRAFWQYEKRAKKWGSRWFVRATAQLQTNKPPILLNIDWQDRESPMSRAPSNKGDNLESGDLL